MLAGLRRNQNKLINHIFRDSTRLTARNLTSCFFLRRKAKSKLLSQQLSPFISIQQNTIILPKLCLLQVQKYSNRADATPSAKGNEKIVSTEESTPLTDVNKTTDVDKKKSWWFGTKERFKQKKAQFLLEYGSTFIFMHEILGITSYVIVFSLLSSGVIPVESVLNFFGWTEADLLKYNINLHGKFTTGAMTYVVVKGLDAMGLVPLRWFLTFTLTPRVAWFIGPKIDRIVAAVKRLFGRKPKAI